MSVKQTSSAWSSLGGRTRNYRRSSGSSKRTKSLADKVKHVARSSEHARPIRVVYYSELNTHTKQYVGNHIGICEGKNRIMFRQCYTLTIYRKGSSFNHIFILN